MKICFKLFASLGSFLPVGAIRNKIELELPEGTTLAALVEQFCLPQAMVHLVLVNGVYIDRVQRETYRLEEGDAVAIWPPIAGG